MGVVIVPPVGYEYWSSHRTLRTLAERLAGQGCCALRFDFDGTGDSAGDQWDPGPGAGLAERASIMRPTPCAGGVSRGWSSSACASAARLP